jgi:nuclear transport factor 2 (NTF2) superfamily protein
MTAQLKPPFTLQTAKLKVQRAEDLWNSKDPEKVALAYSINSQWRNRNVFIQGRKQIAEFLTAKWKRESGYRLKKELFTFSANLIAVQFQYEYHDDLGQWFRAYGIEHWSFDEDGLMVTRDASINELSIGANERQLV